jgi:hypothetical protein
MLWTSTRLREETSPFIWLEAMRPKTWIASIAPIFLGTALAKHLGFFNLWIFLATLGTGLWIQIGTNLANDYFDWKKGSDTPQRVGPRRVMQASLVREEAMLKAIVFSFLLAALFLFLPLCQRRDGGSHAFSSRHSFRESATQQDRWLLLTPDGAIFLFWQALVLLRWG